MARIEFIDLAHSYQAQRGERDSPPPDNSSAWALRPMSVTWEDGGAYALLGPSGCGKTTLLNIISGLVTPTKGRVLFNGVDVTRVPTEQRNIAQVFQFPVIYDTMTVFDNLAFPLKNRGWKGADIRARVGEIAELLELTSDLRNRASGLAADAKQKISLGRGLVRNDVAAILFDEPLTVIDPHLKWLLRRKLKQIHQQLKLSLIYVTHDQIEALTFADTVVVMTQGEIVQSGTARELFEAPAHTFVGRFIGNPGMNLLRCRIVDDCAYVGDVAIQVDAAAASRARAHPGTCTLGIRPEYITLADKTQTQGLTITIESSKPLGAYQLVTARLGSETIAIKAPPDIRIAAGSARINIPAARAVVYVDERRVT